MSYRDDLIRLYASQSVPKVSEAAEYQQLCKRYGEDTRFQRERDKIERAKQYLEACLKPPKTQGEEVRAALALLIQDRHNDNLRDLYHEILVAGYKPGWTAAQQQYFDSAWKKIRSEYDFFLSFTTRYEEVPGDNPINSSYKYFIANVLGWKEFEDADRKRTNLLAHCAYRLLSKPPLKGFYFPHSQYDNSQTEKKLEDACNSCPIFVQLVQNIMFTLPNGRVNYCLFEYEKMNELLQADPEKEQRILFVIAERDRNSLVEALLVPGAYRAWHGHILAKDPPYLAEADMPKKAIVSQLKKTFTDILYPQVKAQWHRMIDQVPV